METQNGEKGDFCFLANIKTFLNTFGMWVEEYWLGGITGVMGFYFTTLKSGIPSVIHGRSEEFEELYAKFTDYFETSLKREQFTDEKQLLIRLSTLLSKGVVPMMWMDEFYLPQAYNYQKNHFWVMAVIRENLSSELIIYNNEEQVVQKKALGPIVFRDGMIEIQYLETGKPGWKYSDKEMVVEGLKRTVENLRKVSTLPEQFFGIEGMKYYKEVFSSCENYKEIYNYFYEMNRGGGLYKTRRNMSLFLQEIGRRWGCKEAVECSELYVVLEEMWTKITNLTFKLSVCKDKALQKRIVKRLEDVIFLEEQGVNSIEKLASILL